MTMYRTKINPDYHEPSSVLKEVRELVLNKTNLVNVFIYDHMGGEYRFSAYTKNKENDVKVIHNMQKNETYISDNGKVFYL